MYKKYQSHGPEEIQEPETAVCCAVGVNAVNSTPGACQDVATLLIRRFMCCFKTLQDIPEAECRFLRQRCPLIIKITGLDPNTSNSICFF